MPNGALPIAPPTVLFGALIFLFSPPANAYPAFRPVVSGADFLLYASNPDTKPWVCSFSYVITHSDGQQPFSGQFRVNVGGGEQLVIHTQTSWANVQVTTPNISCG